MTHQLFDDMIGTPPPSTVDLKAIIERQHRLRRIRRATTTLAGTLTLGLVLVAGLSLTRAKHAIDPPPQIEPSVSAAPTAESADAKAARVSAAWLRATAKVIPGAKWKAGHDGSLESPSRGDYYDTTATLTPPALSTKTNDHDGSPGSWITSDRLYYTFALVQVGGVEGKLHLRTCVVAAPGTRAYCPAEGDCLGVCEQRTGPHGELIKISRSSENVDGYRLPFVQLTVWVRSPDGQSTAEIYLDNVLGPDGSKQTTSKMPLTEDQMIAILLEPGLMI
jgi:hypothetical protein